MDRAGVLHSGVFTRAQFCHYFDTDRKRALRFVKALVARRQAVESETLVFSGGPSRAGYPAADLPGTGAEHIRHRRKAHRDVMMRRLLSLDSFWNIRACPGFPPSRRRSSFLKRSAWIGG